MASIFTKIIQRQSPGYIVWENKHFAALLDINPVNPGHTLVIPRQEVDSIFDLDEQSYSGLWNSVRYLQPYLQKATVARRIGIAVEGFGVPHVHIHMVPVNNGGELDPHRAKKASPEELENMRLQIVRQLQAE